MALPLARAIQLASIIFSLVLLCAVGCGGQLEGSDESTKVTQFPAKGAKVDCSECKVTGMNDRGCFLGACPVPIEHEYTCVVADPVARTCSAELDCDACPVRLCRQSSECSRGQFCHSTHFDCQTTTLEPVGYCLSLTQLGPGSPCDSEYLSDSPVCGCDGTTTYPNECDSLHAGQERVASQHSCL